MLVSICGRREKTLAFYHVHSWQQVFPFQWPPYFESSIQAPSAFLLCFWGNHEFGRMLLALGSSVQHFASRKFFLLACCDGHLDFAWTQPRNCWVGLETEWLREARRPLSLEHIIHPSAGHMPKPHFPSRAFPNINISNVFPSSSDSQGSVFPQTLLCPLSYTTPSLTQASAQIKVLPSVVFPASSVSHGSSPKPSLDTLPLIFWPVYDLTVFGFVFWCNILLLILNCFFKCIF